MLTQAQTKIRDELLQEKAIYKYKYGSDVLDAWLTETLVSLLSTNCNSIFEIGKNPTTFVFSATTYGGDDVVGNTNFVSQVDKTIDGFNYYNKKTGVVFAGIGGGDSNKPNTLSLSDGSPGFDPLLFASTENDDYFANYLVSWTRQNAPVFTVRLIAKPKDSGFFADFFAAIAPILPFAALALNFVLPGAGFAIGSSVLGETLAASYPALANIIGNTAIQTALSGGDIESAVKSSLAGSVGLGAGDFVGAAVDSAAIGSAAAAATSAQLRGGNLRDAVLKSFAVSIGDNAMSGSWSTDPVQYPVDSAVDNSVDPLYDNQTYTDQQINDLNQQASQAAIDANLQVLQAEQSAIIDQNLGVQYGPPAGQTEWGGENRTPVAVQSPQETAFSFDKVISMITAVAKINTAWQAAGKPAPKISGAAYGKGTARVNQDGTITVTDKSGRAATGRPPVGVPFMTANGDVVTNTGSNAYTVVSPNGATSTGYYPSNIDAVSPSLAGVSPLLLLGLAALAFGALK